MSPPIIPERRSSKRGAAESIEELQASRKKMAKTIKESKQRLSRNSSHECRVYQKIDSDFFDNSDWLAHSKVLSEHIAKSRLERKISIQSLPENSAEQAKAWNKTEAAIDSIKREGVLYTQKRLLNA